MPPMSIDHIFMDPSGQGAAQGVLPMLAVKSYGSRMSVSQLVDSTTRSRVADLDWSGWQVWVFKSGQESAILALKQAFRESMSTVQFVMEDSRPQDPCSRASVKRHHRSHSA